MKKRKAHFIDSFETPKYAHTICGRLIDINLIEKGEEVTCKDCKKRLDK